MVRNLTLDDWIIVSDLGGNCPVQAEGSLAIRESRGQMTYVKYYPFYFRARWSTVSFNVGAPGKGANDAICHPIWEFSEPYSDPVGAGWMEDDEALAFIRRAAYLLITRPDDGSEGEDQ